METKSTTESKQYYSRKEREDNIRSHSESFGNRWCGENAAQLLPLIKDFKAGKKTSTLKVRTYNRVDNKMIELPLEVVLENITLDKNGVPARLRPTQFGQVVISPSIHLSSIVYYVISALWAATMDVNREEPLP